jgi:DNA recombination protein RmuC
MFVPSEAAFAEINAYYDELVDYANKKRVLITSPTTLMALLKVIMVVHKDSELSKNAKYLFKELEILGKDFKLYSRRWESLQKDIDKVTQDVKEINTTTNKLSNKFDKIQNGRISYLKNEETVE